jgi:hypothetical protein
MQIAANATVKLKAYGGQVIQRKVVFIKNNKVYVCLESEFLLASQEHRRPECIGFPMSDVVQDNPEHDLGS